MRTFLLLATAVATASLAHAQSYRHFEAGQATPLAVSADGGRLYVCNTNDDHLSVYGLADPSAPRLLLDVPVGLAPVSVAERTADEAWVVCWLSDSVEVVSLAEGRVVDSLRVPDEPGDVVFAGGKAFVTAQASDEVHVFDAATRAPLGSIPITGRDPRSMVASPDGTKVWVAVLRSGNRTTILPVDDAPPPFAPTNPALGPAPDQGLIVRDDDPVWDPLVPTKLYDHDVLELDVATQTVTRTFSDVGTVLYDLDVDPATGDLYVANLDARNLVPFEPVLAGHAVFSRITKVTTGAVPTVTAWDLNPGIDYATLPNAGALATALAEPTGVAFDAGGARLFVAAQGTDRVGVVGLDGVVTGFVELGAPGAGADPRTKRGPRALALHPVDDVLYVHNRLASSLSVVDTTTLAPIAELPFSHDPMDANEKQGRGFLYDAKLSGNGTLSCAACHVDVEWDGLAWDLGDPGGDEDLAVTGQPFPFNLGVEPFHPMKGPMTTQTLRGLAGAGPFHWRGDRPVLESFQRGFTGILGGAALTAPDLDDLVHFLESVEYPPNPNQNLDRSMPSGPGPNPAQGAAFFETSIASFLGFQVSCEACHALPLGTNGFVIGNQLAQQITDALPDQLKVPHLRAVYRKDNPADALGFRKLGFGLVHDGELQDVDQFVAIDAFDDWPTHMMDDIARFLLHFDTGTAPVVGYRRHVSQADAASSEVVDDVALLEARAAAGDADVVVEGELLGQPHGLVYDPLADAYVADDPALGPYSWAALQSLLLAGDAELVWTGVPLGSGARIGTDRDGDGTPDGVDGLRAYGAPTPGCAGEPRLSCPTEPALGEELVFVARNVVPGALGLLGVAAAPATFPALGVTLHVNVAAPGFLLLPMNQDASGFATATVTVPNDPGLLGTSRFCQAVFTDPCGAANWAATNGLETRF